MKLRRVLALFLAICMTILTPCQLWASEIKVAAEDDIEFNAGDVAIVMNNCVASDMIRSGDNLKEKNCLEAEAVFETGTSQLAPAAEEEEEETKFYSLQQALDDTDKPYVDVVAETDEETGMNRLERHYKSLDLSFLGGLKGSASKKLKASSENEYKVGDTKIIKSQTNDEKTGEVYYRMVNVKCLYIGKNCTVWCEIDDNYPNLTMTNNQAEKLAGEFDDNWVNFKSYYGDYRNCDGIGAYYPGQVEGFDKMDVDGDGKLALVCYDINNARKNATVEGGRLRLNLGAYFGGFFCPGDLYPGDNSNEMDCVHIDTVCSMSKREDDGTVIDDQEHIFGNMERAYSTLFHESQHLTEAARTTFRSLPSYLDEAFAMSAEHLVCGSGATSARINYFNDDYTYGCPITMWCYDGYPMKTCLDNYSSSYIFGQYLRTRYAQSGKSQKKSDPDRGADIYNKILDTYCRNLEEYDAENGFDPQLAESIRGDLSTAALEEIFDTTSMGKEFGAANLEDLIGDFWYAIYLKYDNGKYSFSSDRTEPEEWSKAISARLETELPTGKTKIYNGGAKFYQITENGTKLKTAYLKDADVFKLDGQALCDVEFWLASPSDDTRVYDTVYATASVASGELVDEPKDPNPKDYGIDENTYEFSGWFEDTNLEYPFDFDEPIYQNKEVYGSWIEKGDKKSITVTFCANAPEDTTTDIATYSQTATASEIFTLKKNNFKLNCPLMEYTFYAWSSTSDLESPGCKIYQDEEEVVFTENTKLYAIWIQDYDHIVIFDANGGKSDYCALVDDMEIIAKKDIPEPTRSGFSFSGWWYMDDEGKEYIKEFDFNTPITENLYLYAKWSGKSSGGSGSSSGYTYSKTINPDPAVTPITMAANGNQMMGNATISIKIENLSAEEKAALVTKGTWEKDTYGYWSLKGENGNAYKNCWVLVADTLGSNPVGNASWYYFDASGHMVTGWQWLTGADGKKYCYYFNKEGNSMYGGCIMNGTTVDNYSVDAKGRWTEQGVLQTR